MILKAPVIRGEFSASGGILRWSRMENLPLGYLDTSVAQSRTGSAVAAQSVKVLSQRSQCGHLERVGDATIDLATRESNQR